MLQKFAQAVKTKTVEFFAEEEEEEEEEELTTTAIDEIITGQRVVVIKPDGPVKHTASFSSPISPDAHHHHLQKTLVSSLFTTISSFHAAYLQLQTAHEPFNRESIESADKVAVSHLRRLADIKKAYRDLSRSANSAVPLSSEPEAQVQENQSMLRMLETVFNRLQSDIDEKDAKVSALKQELRESEKCNALMERRLDGVGSSSSGLLEEEKAFLSIGVFEAVLKESCKEAHRFAKVLVDEMKKSGWELDLVANSMYPNVDYAKRGHCRYALLSYICLEMFSGFASDGFGSICNGDGMDGIKEEISGRNSLSQFVEHLTVDAVEVLNTMPDSAFALFCENKYRKLIHPDMETSLFGDMEWWDPVLRSWQPSNPLYEPYIAMCSSIWMLHKLALAFDRPVEIFQAGQGADFSIVYMENVVRTAGSKTLCCLNSTPKVGFTISPGFRVGSMVIQCKVYPKYLKLSL